MLAPRLGKVKAKLLPFTRPTSLNKMLRQNVRNANTVKKHLKIFLKVTLAVLLKFGKHWVKNVLFKNDVTNNLVLTDQSVEIVNLFSGKIIYYMPSGCSGLYTPNSLMRIFMTYLFVPFVDTFQPAIHNRFQVFGHGDSENTRRHF